MAIRVLFCGRSRQFAYLMEDTKVIPNIENVGYVVPKEKTFVAECISAANTLGVPIYENHIDYRIKADLVISMYYDRLFKSDYLQKHFVVNVHNSLLPNYRGIRPISYAIANKDNEIGCTLHVVDEGIDTGPIIDQARIALDSNRNIQEIRNEIMVLGRNMLFNFLQTYPNFVTKKQDVSVGSYHSLADALKDGMI